MPPSVVVPLPTLQATGVCVLGFWVKTAGPVVWAVVHAFCTMTVGVTGVMGSGMIPQLHFDGVPVTASGAPLLEMRQARETSKVRRRSWSRLRRERSGRSLEHCSRIANWRPEEGSAVRVYFLPSLRGCFARSVVDILRNDCV